MYLIPRNTKSGGSITKFLEEEHHEHSKTIRHCSLGDWILLCEKSRPRRGPIHLPLAGDDQGKIYGHLNDYSKKMPTAGLLMEIMFQLTANSLLATHVKRNFDQWADDLTHPTYEGFDENLRLDVASLLPFLGFFLWVLCHLDPQRDWTGDLVRLCQPLALLVRVSIPGR